MTSILSVKASVSGNQLKCNYLKIETFFLNFFPHLQNLDKIWNTLKKKKWASEVICFWNYRLQKAELLKCPKSALPEHLWTVNVLKGPKHFLNLNSSIFLMFFDHSERERTPRTLF